MTTPTHSNSGFLSPAQPSHTGLVEPDLIVELRKALSPILRSVHPRVYYEKAPENVKYAYLVYNLPNSIDQGNTKLFILDVDGWDAPENGDTTQLEVLMGLVDRELDRRVIRTEAFSATTYSDRRFPVEDSDKRIRRRKSIYEVRLIKKRRDYHG